MENTPTQLWHLEKQKDAVSTTIPHKQSLRYET
jgi:hypothetical protein